jgi:branched-subunit amino acid transport protein
MSELALWAVILGGGLLTYATRASFITLLPAERVPALVERGLRFVPAAVLAALVSPELMLRGGTLDFSLENHRLLAGLLAAAFAWRFRNTWATIGVGMAALWLLGAV